MFTYEYLDGGRTLHFHGSGELTGQEMIDANIKLQDEEERVRHVTSCLIVLDGITKLDVTPDDIRTLVSIDTQLARVSPNMALAVVAPADHVFGMARMWETMVARTGWATAVFRTRAEADTWLKAQQLS